MIHLVVKIKKMFIRVEQEIKNKMKIANGIGKIGGFDNERK